jgi:Mg-chelatase subunit ChlD
MATSTYGRWALAVVAGALVAALASPMSQGEARAATMATGRVAQTTETAPAAFSVTVDGQTVTADSLPSPEAYYAGLLAKDGADLSPCGAPSTPAPGQCPKPASLGSVELRQQINVELILDASGSMAEDAGDGQSKLDVAKRVLSDFLTTLPPNANVALRVYGHKGSSSEADKDASCAATELLYPFQPLDATPFQQAINSFQPTGWTPLAASFDAARQDFAPFDPATSSNFVYVVTDGLETCDGDPVAAAGALHQASVQPIVNVVGFDTDADAAAQMQQAADAGGGTFYQANNADDLQRVFTQDVNWTEWTKYYECLLLAATTQWETAVGSSTASWECVVNRITQEWEAVTQDATTRWEKIAQAATAAYEHADGSPAVTAAHDALLRRSLENQEYVTQHEMARHDAITQAANDQQAAAVAKAQADYAQAVQEAEQSRPPTMGP